MKVYLVPQEHITQIYPDIEKYVDRMVPTAYGRFEKIDLVNDILSGKATLWVIMDEEDDNKLYGIIFTEWSYYPRKKMLSISFAAGDKLDSWIEESLKVLENWAVDNDCDAMEITGRKGWVKKLKDYDWKQEFIIVKKENLKKRTLEVVKTEKKEWERKAEEELLQLNK